jgi:hypothetical protein
MPNVTEGAEYVSKSSSDVTVGTAHEHGQHEGMLEVSG